MVTSVSRLICVLALPLLCGCAGFRSNTVGDIDPWPLTPTSGQKSIVVSVRGVEGDIHAELSKGVMKAFEDSGLFSQVRPGIRGGDIQAELNVTHTGEMNPLMTTLCGYTFCLIPAKASDTYQVETTFKDKEGNALGQVMKSEKHTMWMQTFLLFVWPFKNPNRVVEDIYYDLGRSTLIEAQATEVL